MKKSKIIVPALGLLLLSTAASVSGTVAWFTANRTYTNTISSFGVEEVDGALEVESITDLVGVTTTDNVTEFVVDERESMLADGSFDAATQKLYTDNGSVTAEGEGVNRSSFIDLGTGTTDAAGANAKANWKAGTKTYTTPAKTVDLFYAVSWQINFVYNYAADGDEAVNLFVDLSNTGTSFVATDGSGAGDHIKTALRIAVIVGTEYKVLVPFYTAATAAAADPALAGATSTTGVTAYSSRSTKTNYSSNGTGAFDLAKAADKAGGESSRLDYLGQFTNATPNTTNKLSARVVVWLEGTDNNTLTGNIKDTFSGTLKFYSTIA